MSSSIRESGFCSHVSPSAPPGKPGAPSARCQEVRLSCFQGPRASTACPGCRQLSPPGLGLLGPETGPPSCGHACWCRLLGSSPSFLSSPVWAAGQSPSLESGARGQGAGRVGGGRRLPPACPYKEAHPQDPVGLEAPRLPARPQAWSEPPSLRAEPGSCPGPRWRALSEARPPAAASWTDVARLLECSAPG